MYLVVLTLHSYTRWAVLVLGLWALLRACSGRGVWAPMDERAGRLFVGVFDLQMLLGLILYVALSPITQVAFANFGAAMRDHVMRFWAVEHITGMLVALVCAHVGRAKTRRLTIPTSRHRAAAIWFGVSLLVLLASIPWPFLPYGRALLRF